jgi:hypothetical protein
VNLKLTTNCGSFRRRKELRCVGEPKDKNGPNGTQGQPSIFDIKV